MIIYVGLRDVELVLPSKKSTDKRKILVITDLLDNEVRIAMNDDGFQKLCQILEESK